MIDLHTHSFLSDGELIPSELIRRYEAKGYRAVAITDHCDHSNLEDLLSKLIRLKKEISSHSSILFIPGIEITHVHPKLIGDLIDRARKMGAEIVVVHGESIVEPVLKGTNRAAIEAGADILAHPGLIEMEDVVMAKERGVFLELSARKGHCLTNGHVARLAMEKGAPLLLNSDSHSPSDIMDEDLARSIVKGAGLDSNGFRRCMENARLLLKKKGYSL